MNGLEHVEIGMYRGLPGRSPEIVAEALRAAGDTVSADRPVRSLHAYFVRPSDVTSPVLYRVEETSAAVRRVSAQQHGKPILTVMASFGQIEQGASRRPASLSAEHFDLELRFIDPPAWVRFRARNPLPPDPLAHACVAAYASNLLALRSAAALDHAIWFHRPFRADDWLAYEQESVWTDGGRALCRGSLFDTSGTLVATAAQEAAVAT
jgi:acyl-CoA thioesterase-2